MLYLWIYVLLLYVTVACLFLQFSKLPKTSSYLLKCLFPGHPEAHTGWRARPIAELLPGQPGATVVCQYPTAWMEDVSTLYVLKTLGSVCKLSINL